MVRFSLHSVAPDDSDMTYQQVSSEDISDIAIATLISVLQESSTGDFLHVVLTGGETGMRVTSRLPEVAVGVHESIWNRVHLWWGDERFVASDSPLRNDYNIREILGKFYSPGRVHQVASTDDCGSVSDAADRYAAELAEFGSTSPLFTIVFLGMGPDGHVASLFPHSPQLHSTKVCVPVIDSPKPPSERVSMTFRTLNNSNRTLLFANGTHKEEALNKLMAPRGSIEQIPARGVSAGLVEILS